MVTLSCLEWIMHSNSIVLSVVLLTFVFGLIFKLIRG